MLKALELVGFKSFAEKTRFEFPSGITVVVGPNGSGKSNIVDAIKWVLGEQSVKSLRGKEMADVIFNGSGTRRPMNAAEVTLTFANSGGLFAIDTPEVHITRRVYRSGEGEYLINRQPSRLRDIRDLLAGTGLGTQAYSVIEQGKVDVLLQSSSRDRRVIFEEAAGISRFKAKKVEALRRLERVEQNLLRLSDIVDEVDNRLRSVRAQAGKARRYKQYADRLQELRTQVGQVDWARLSQRLAVFEQELEDLDSQRGASVAEAEATEARLLEMDTQISDTGEAIRACEVQNAGNRERIAAGESTIEHERSRCRDLEQEIARHRRQLAATNLRAGDYQQQLRETAEAVESAEADHRRIAQALVEGERAVTGLMARLDRTREEEQQRRAVHIGQMRAVALLGNEVGRLESQVAATTAAGQQNQRRTAELDGQLDLLGTELEDLCARRDELAGRADALAAQLAAAKDLLEHGRQQQAARQRELAQWQQRHSGVSERIAVLEELQQRQEGLTSGVKEVLQQARAASDGPLSQIRGLVADLLEVSVEGAPLVEVALGEAAQCVVVSPGGQLLELLESETYRFPGRVGFVWLEGGPARVPGPAAPGPEQVDLTGRPGVLARADAFVETEPQYTSLAKRLLGRTWIVEKLSHAVGLAASVGRGLSFVTLAGELLSADGTLSVGPPHTSTGLISRRSELRALETERADLQGKITHATAALEEITQQATRTEREVHARDAEHQEAVEALSRHAHKITAAEERHSQLDRQRTVLEAEREAADAQCAAAQHGLSEAVSRREEAEAQLREMEAGLAGLTQQLEALEAEFQDHLGQTTETKVELAKSEERLGNLHGRMRQVEEGRQERHRAVAEAREQLTQAAARVEQAQWSILRRESEIAELYLKKESFAAQVVELVNQREAIRTQRTELTAAAQKCRARARRLEEKSHAKQLEASEVRHQRSTLADRLREDYGIELAQLEHEPTAEEQQQREQVQQEIDDLRRKLNNLGNVNLEALEELDQLEGRHGSLAEQYKDLVAAKSSLERIIERINTDSRRLFAETLETVRGHFQNLFRDLFGGGRADIVLEDEADILESGVEIVARPPGKEPRSISLLSGGEKTLTCVALLLAIFRSRPSPFCVLDEVDAALDEANIGRFTEVLQDFLAWTQFIIVTHSKKTMTCANTIYGVTMQESGVSKQVSVRFEDVSEDGEILVDTSTAPPASEAIEGPPEDADETQAA